MRSSWIYKSLIMVTQVFCVFWMCSVAWADYISPDQVKVVTKRYHPGERGLAAGQYHYTVSWQAIPVASAVIDISKQMHTGGAQAKVVIGVKTNKAISLLYKLRHQSQSTFDSETYSPFNFVSYQTENSKERYREIMFGEQGRVRSKRWKTGGELTELDFVADNPLFDPISAALLAKTLPLETGGQVSFDVFNGKHRYLIAFDILEKDTVHVAGEKREAYRVQPIVKKLTDTEGEKKLRSVYLWISTGADRDILKLESEVWIGSVKAELEKYIPKSAPDTLRARLGKP